MAAAVVVVSRALTFVAFLLTLLALWIPGWGVYCGPCYVLTNPDWAAVHTCMYIGMFDWCFAQQGMESCYGCTWIQ
jgi:hypothetical protein